MTPAKKYPGVFPHGNGFRGQIKFQGKVHRTAVFRTQRQASDARQPLREKLEHKSALTSGPSEIPSTVRGFRLWWIADLRKQVEVAAARGRPEDALKKQTIANYEALTKAFADEHGDRQLRDVDVEQALIWLLWADGPADQDRRWTLGGLRSMFSAARKSGKVDSNPFAGLRLRGTHGRRDLQVLTEAEVLTLADRAIDVWGEYGQVWRAIILLLGFAGMRPAELYALRPRDFDLKVGEVRIERQYVPSTREFDSPKNGRARTVALGEVEIEALRALPAPLDRESTWFRTKRGAQLCGRNQHYYWSPIRSAFGNASMDLYELRHFCGSFLLNDLQLPAQDVAAQLGHTDGGSLVLALYGHPSAELARTRIRAARRLPRRTNDDVVQLDTARMGPTGIPRE